MEKKILSLLLAAVMLFSFLPVTALAGAAERSYDPCNGGAVKKADKVPSVPTWSGYTFDNWYEQRTGGAAISDKKVSAYYAHWKNTSNHTVLTETLYVDEDGLYAGNDETTMTDTEWAAYGISYDAEQGVLTLTNATIVAFRPENKYGIQSELDSLTIHLVGANQIGQTFNGYEADKDPLVIGEEKYKDPETYRDARAAYIQANYPTDQGIDFDGDLCFTGDKTASLSIYDQYSGIESASASFTDFAGTLTVEDYGESAKCAILCEGDISIGGGTFVLTSRHSKGVYADGGTVTIASGDVTVNANAYVGDGSIHGIYGSNGVIISGGTVTVNVKNSNRNSCGIYGREYVSVTGGTVKAFATAANAEARGIYAENHPITISGGNVTANADGYAGSYGICGENGTTISGGNVTASASSRCSAIGIGGVEDTGTITVSGGTVTTSAIADGEEETTAYGIGGTYKVMVTGGTVGALASAPNGDAVALYANTLTVGSVATPMDIGNGKDDSVDPVTVGVGVVAGGKLKSSDASKPVTIKAASLPELVDTTETDVYNEYNKGDTTTKVQVTGDAGAKAKTGGLNQIATEIKEEYYNEEEEYVDVKVVLTVSAAEKTNIPEAESSAIQTAAGSKTVKYLSIDLKKTIGSSTPTKITNAGSVLEILLPYDLSNKQDVAFYRYHDGAVRAFDKLAAATAGADGTFYVEGSGANAVLHVFTDKFSTYAIGYEEQSSGGGFYTPGHTVTSDLNNVTKVTVDGKTVDSKYYTVSGGNVYLTGEFMKTLTNGKHTVKVYDGLKVATGTMTVTGNAPVQSASTGDTGIVIYGVLAISSLLSMGWVSRKKH